MNPEWCEREIARVSKEHPSPVLPPLVVSKRITSHMGHRFFFLTLVTGAGRSLSLNLSDTTVTAVTTRIPRRLKSSEGGSKGRRRRLCSAKAPSKGVHIERKRDFIIEDEGRAGQQAHPQGGRGCGCDEA